MQCVLAKLLGDLIRNFVQRSLLFSFRFIEQLQLNHSKLIKLTDSKSNQSNWQMILWQAVAKQLDAGFEQFACDIRRGAESQ